MVSWMRWAVFLGVHRALKASFYRSGTIDVCTNVCMYVCIYNIVFQLGSYIEIDYIINYVIMFQQLAYSFGKARLFAEQRR
jgi:hypothetical protein